MACIYIYRIGDSTKEFGSEVELDDFLLSNQQYENEFGDLVFSLPAGGLAARSNAKEIQKKTKDLKKKQKTSETIYMDDEKIIEYHKPYIGVTKFLNEFVDELGHPLFPIFTPEEYWKRRRRFWGDESQNLDEEYDSDTGTGVYTKEEKELIFGDQPPSRLSEKEMDIWQDIITQKWRQQGLLGEDIHHCLEMFFKKYDGAYNFQTYKNRKTEFIQMIKKYTYNFIT